MADNKNTSNVSTPRSEYAKDLPSWILVEDACAGEVAVKAATVKYLPKPNPKDVSEENRSRYEQYLLRAVYYNAVGRTLSGLLGIAFRRDAEITVPAAMEYMKDDADGAGLSLAHKGQQLLSNVLMTGRSGVLVDYPRVEGVTSVAAAVMQEIRPIICLYAAQDVINWRSIRVGGKMKLSLVVLREGYEADDSEWVRTEKTQYRVLRLMVGIYTTEVWRENPERPGDWHLYEAPSVVVQGNGQSWTEIPFTFVGSNDNDTDVDPSPLYDLAVLNLAHYRNSADYEDSAYLVGQPMFYIAGLSEAEAGEKSKSGVYIGSRQVLSLPHGGTAGVMQVEPNSLCRQAMLDKESQMAALGARLLISTGQVKTATQQNSEDAAAHSVLTLCCNNVSKALTRALGWFATFQNLEGVDCEYEINTEFVIDALDAQTLVALLQLVQAGKMPESDLWTQLRQVGLIDAEKTDDDIREEIDSQAPPGVTSVFGTPRVANEGGGGSGDGKGGSSATGDTKTTSSGTGNPEGITTNVPRAAVGG